MILASYNLENLFDRPKVLNQASADDKNRWEEGRQTLTDFAHFNALIAKQTYSSADKNKMLKLLGPLGLEKSDDGPFVILRQNRGHLLKRGKDGTISIVAKGRRAWIGWLELLTEPAEYTAILNTGRVIADIKADVLAVVEAESRIALARFNKAILPEVKGKPYDHVMLIDGNDERGIDVGIMTRSGFEIESIQSHVDDADTKGKIFSRDCPVYTIPLKGGKRLCILINHLKSKGYGDQKANNARRLNQAQRVLEIYNELVAEGHDLIAVVGDFNDTPTSAPLAPLCGPGSPLTDVFKLSGFEVGEKPGTFGNCAASGKIDYILLSPELQKAFKKGGVFRKGVWGGKNGDMWPIYKEMKESSDAASDHAAVWAEIAL